MWGRPSTPGAGWQGRASPALPLGQPGPLVGAVEVEVQAGGVVAVATGAELAGHVGPEHRLLSRTLAGGNRRGGAGRLPAVGQVAGGAGDPVHVDAPGLRGRQAGG